ncbi:MAG: hypothetical protein HY588_00030, partial [Candidatus Omnitrophica bacterium]|nr:hypothetical protein [Candidatus Omnitrophota bacterium]
RKVIVLGDMLELGSEAHAYHEALGKHLAEKGFSLAIGVGPMSRAVLDILDGTTTAHFPEAKSAAQFLVSALEDQDAILIKGSHGMRLDQVKCFLDDYIKRTATLV